jgi:hypothetical protein
MKKTILLLIVFVAAFFLIRSCMKPDNTLSVIQSGWKRVYLTSIDTVGEKNDESAYLQMLEEVRTGNGDYFIQFNYTEGFYPIRYSEKSYLLHIIPYGKRIKLKSRLTFYGIFKNRKLVSDGEPSGEWQDEGYSHNNTLCAKILEYYWKNKDTLQ